MLTRMIDSARWWLPKETWFLSGNGWSEMGGLLLLALSTGVMFAASSLLLAVGTIGARLPVSLFYAVEGRPVIPTIWMILTDVVLVPPLLAVYALLLYDKPDFSLMYLLPYCLCWI